MQIDILINIIKQMEHWQKIVLLAKHYIELNTILLIYYVFLQIMCILCIFAASIILGMRKYSVAYLLLCHHSTSKAIKNSFFTTAPSFFKNPAKNPPCS